MKKLIAFVVLASLAGGWTFLPQEETPEAALKDFADAISQRDAKRAATRIVGGQEANVNDLAMAGVKLDIRPTRTIQQGDEAAVIYTLTLKEGSGRSVESEEIVTLRRTEDRWQIVPLKIDSRGNSVPLIARAIADRQFLSQHRDLSTAGICINNGKQLAICLLIYITDNDDIFAIKPTQEDFVAQAKPYAKNDKIFTCPSSGHSYSWNTKLAGINAVDIDEPSKTVMVYEGKDGQLDFRHDGKAVVSFTDSSTKLVSPEEAKSLIWAVK